MARRHKMVADRMSLVVQKRKRAKGEQEIKQWKLKKSFVNFREELRLWVVQ